MMSPGGGGNPLAQQLDFQLKRERVLATQQQRQQFNAQVAAQQANQGGGGYRQMPWKNRGGRY